MWEAIPRCGVISVRNSAISRWVTDKLAILRGLTHGDPDHTAGYHVMMTGAHPGTGAAFNRNKHDNNVHPCLGSMVAKVGGGNGSLPPYISVPNFLNSGGPAFLGASYAPFVIESDPASPEFSVRDIVLPEGKYYLEMPNDYDPKKPRPVIVFLQPGIFDLPRAGHSAP